MRQAHEAAREQTRAAEQDQREGHLDHDERAAQTSRAPRSSRASLV